MVRFGAMQLLQVSALWTLTIHRVFSEPPPVELKPPVHYSSSQPPPSPRTSKLGISTHMKFSMRPFSLKTSIDFSRSPDNNGQHYSSPAAPIKDGYANDGGYSSSGYASAGGYSYKPPEHSGGYSYKPPEHSDGYSYNPPRTSGYSYQNDVANYRPPYYSSSSYQPYRVTYEGRSKDQSTYDPYYPPAYKYDPWKPVYSPPSNRNREMPDLVKHIYLHSGKRKSDFHYKLVLVNKHNPSERHEIHLPPIPSSEQEHISFHGWDKAWNSHADQRLMHPHVSGHIPPPYTASRKDFLHGEYSTVNRSPFVSSAFEPRSF